MMRRNKIAVKLDENIGTAFIIDLDTTLSVRGSKAMTGSIWTHTELANEEDSKLVSA